MPPVSLPWWVAKERGDGAQALLEVSPAVSAGYLSLCLLAAEGRALREAVRTADQRSGELCGGLVLQVPPRHWQARLYTEFEAIRWAALTAQWEATHDPDGRPLLCDRMAWRAEFGVLDDTAAVRVLASPECRRLLEEMAGLDVSGIVDCLRQRLRRIWRHAQKRCRRG